MFITTVQYQKLNLSDDSILTPSPCPGAPVYPDLASRLMDLTVLTFHTDEFIQTWPFCAWLLPLVSCLQAVCILWYVSVLCSLLSPNNILLPACILFIHPSAVKVLRSVCQQIWKTQLWPQD